MTNKPAQTRDIREGPPEHRTAGGSQKNRAAGGSQENRAAGSSPDLRAHQTQIEALKAELFQKDALLNQGFAAFTQAAEKLQESHKRLQKQIAELNLELDAKNQELERNLVEKEKVKTYLSNIFENLQVGVLVTDLEGGITSVNRVGLAMLGLEAEAIIGVSVNEILGADLISAKSDEAESDFSQVELEEPILFPRKDEETLKIQVSINMMTGEENKSLGYILNLQDVTLLKKLEEHAERRNRFTTMGEMAANIAHEIRNPLGSIELFASLIKKGLGENDDEMELANHISSGINSMNHIISNLLEYTKPRPITLQKLNLTQLLKEVVEFSSFMAKQNQVKVKTKISSPEVWIKGDVELLKQVFQNLFQNALQAMPEGGTFSITTRKRTLTNLKMLSRLGDNPTPPGNRREVVEVDIKDTGYGINPEIQRQIFDPFFTTKEKGTGLGLAIVHNIIEAHQGIIDLESRVNQGATFILMFPTIDK